MIPHVHAQVLTCWSLLKLLIFLFRTGSISRGRSITVITFTFGFWLEISCYCFLYPVIDCLRFSVHQSPVYNRGLCGSCQGCMQHLEDTIARVHHRTSLYMHY